jgi:hypothetical protein
MSRKSAQRFCDNDMRFRAFNAIAPFEEPRIPGGFVGNAENMTPL